MIRRRHSSGARASAAATISGPIPLGSPSVTPGRVTVSTAKTVPLARTTRFVQACRVRPLLGLVLILPAWAGCAGADAMTLPPAPPAAVHEVTSGELGL